MTCKDQASFPRDGYGDEKLHFTKDWTGGTKCRPVQWTTPYPATTRDSYKRCICNYFGQDGPDHAVECALEEATF